MKLLALGLAHRSGGQGLADAGDEVAAGGNADDRGIGAAHRLEVGGDGRRARGEVLVELQAGSSPRSAASGGAAAGRRRRRGRGRRPARAAPSRG